MKLECNAFLLLMTALIACGAEYAFKVECDKPAGIYSENEPVVFSADLKQDGLPCSGTAECIVRKNGHDVETMVTAAGKPFTLTSSLDRPGWISVLIRVKGEDGGYLRQNGEELRAEAGVVVAPEKLSPAMARPADFDAFWQEQKAALDKVPFNLKKVEVPVKNEEWRQNFVCYDVSLDTTGPAPVRGYLMLPKNARPKSLPIIIGFHSYGVFSAWQPGGFGTAITFEMNAHGIPNGMPDSFYRQKARELGWYPHAGKDSRENSYIKHMYIRALRALQYLKTLPEWDGKVIVARGGSQGGGQALALAGLDPDVTLVLADVPALCDFSAPLQDRMGGWPQFYGAVNGKPESPEVADAVAYLDNANFAPNIKAGVYLSCGGCDWLCPPTAVWTCYNMLKSAKSRDIAFDPHGRHDNRNEKGEKFMWDMLRNEYWHRQ